MHPEMYGNPDFAHKRKRIAIFCDGDFWHGYRYDEKKKPAKKYWRDKIEKQHETRQEIQPEGSDGTGGQSSDSGSMTLRKNPEKCRRKIMAKFRSR